MHMEMAKLPKKEPSDVTSAAQFLPNGWHAVAFPPEGGGGSVEETLGKTQAEPQGLLPAGLPHHIGWQDIWCGVEAKAVDAEAAPGQSASVVHGR